MNKVNQIIGEREEIKKMKAMSVIEETLQKKQKQNKKEEYKEANAILQKRKNEYRDFENEAKLYEAPSHFPYTHGDAVEKEQALLGELKRLDYRDKLLRDQVKRMEDKMMKYDQ